MPLDNFPHDFDPWDDACRHYVSIITTIDLARLRHLKPGWCWSISWSRGGRPTGSIPVQATSATCAWPIATGGEMGPGRKCERSCPSSRRSHLLRRPAPLVRMSRVRKALQGALWRWALPVSALPATSLRLAVRNRRGSGAGRAQKLRMRLGGSANLLMPFRPGRSTCSRAPTAGSWSWMPTC